jgi:hypothetical protein
MISPLKISPPMIRHFVWRGKVRARGSRGSGSKRRSSGANVPVESRMEEGGTNGDASEREGADNRTRTAPSPDATPVKYSKRARRRIPAPSDVLGSAATVVHADPTVGGRTRPIVNGVIALAREMAEWQGSFRPAVESGG